MSDLLVARELRKRFDEEQAVDGVSLRVDAGERVALVGPNGAGKTTTLLMLMGVIEADEGTVHLAGATLPGQRAEAMAKVGFAAGYLPLPNHLQVIETLQFFAQLHGLDRPREAAADALDQWSIGHLAHQQTQTLSSGQATLVGLAKAVIHRPTLVVLDEPTASLDPEVAHRVRQGLLALNRDRGTALLLTSHDMREVELLSERMVFLAHGRVLHEGPPAQVVAAAGQPDLETLFLTVAGVR